MSESDGRVSAADVVRAVALDSGDVRNLRCSLADLDENDVVDDDDRRSLIALTFSE